MWPGLFEFVDPLDREGIPYAVVGSVAASLYGEPRATNDVDLVIQVGTRDVPRLMAAFPTKSYYLPPEEVLLVELGRRHGAHINVISQESMVKADLYPLPDLQQPWFGRRRSVAVGDRKLWVAAPEVVILHKLLFFREGGGEKHLRDIRAMLGVLGTALDRPWLDREIARLQLSSAWSEVGRAS